MTYRFDTCFKTNAACTGNANPVDLSCLFVLQDYFTCAGLWNWGCNANGRLGNNTTVNTSSPIQTVTGGSNWRTIDQWGATGAIKIDGTLWTWGDNFGGLLGDNSTVTSRSSPVQVVGSASNWRCIFVGELHMAAIKTDGTFWTWGFGGDGRLGDNTLTSKSSPVQTASAGCNWKTGNAGVEHTAGVKTDGTLWTWGSGLDGRLGDNTTVNKSTPIQVGVDTTWRQVSLAWKVSAAVKTDGTLWGWGCNDEGQLGNNSSVTRFSSPVQTVAGGTNWRQASAGNANILAVKNDGTLWGSGLGCVTGQNAVTNRSSPVQTVAGGTNWKCVSVRGSSAAALKTDGTLWVWGDAANGALGDNSTVSKSSPVQTAPGGNYWRAAASGNLSKVAIRDCW